TSAIGTSAARRPAPVRPAAGAPVPSAPVPSSAVAASGTATAAAAGSAALRWSFTETFQGNRDTMAQYTVMDWTVREAALCRQRFSFTVGTPARSVKY